jgi:hypothetical protein
LTFQDARLKLLAYVRDQVRNGEFTERGFARMIGISQPHAHNVLKGVRNLSPEIFDQTLKNLNLSLLDLAPLDEIEAQLQQRGPERMVEIPFHQHPIGPGEPWSPVVNKTFQLSFPSAVVPAELVMVKLAADAAMAATVASYDLALLDISTRCRSSISPEGLYVVERNGEAVLRYIRPGAQHSYLVTDADLNHPAAWEPLPFSHSHMHDVVKARVMWVGREREREGSVQRGRFLDDPISW